MRLLFVTLLMGVCITAQAATSPFADFVTGFNGGCPSFGVSMQNAIEKVRRTQTLLEQLKSSTQCQGIQSSLNVTNRLDQELQRLSSPNVQDILRLQNDIEELTLLANTLPSSSLATNEFNNNLLLRVSDELAVKRVELAIKVSKDDSDQLSYFKRHRRYGTLPEIQTVLTDLSQQLPHLETCVSGKPNTFAQVVGNLLPAVAMLGNPAFGVAASSVGPLMTKLSNYISSRRYNVFIRDLEKIQMEMAIGCAIENIQFSVCEAKDGMHLIEWAATEEFKKTQKKSEQSLAWQGYHLLTKELGTLSSWIESIQNGQTPQKIEDSTFNNSTDMIEYFYRTAKSTIDGYINEANRDVQGKTDQQNRGLELLERIYVEMVGTPNAVQVRTNVFLRIVAKNELACFLVGKSPNDFVSPGSQDSSSSDDCLSLVRNPTKKSILPLNLVDTIAQRFTDMVTGSNLSTGIGAENILASILAERRVADPVNILMKCTIADDDMSSPCDVLHELADWLEAILEDPKSFSRAYQGVFNSGQQSQLARAFAEDTLKRVRCVIREIERTQPLSDLDDPDHCQDSTYRKPQVTAKTNPVDKQNTQSGERDLAKIASRKITNISLHLNILKSRDRFLIERISSLVKIYLRSEIDSPRTPDHIRQIIHSANQDLIQKITGYKEANQQAIYDSFVNSLDANKKHMQLLAEFFKIQIANQLADNQKSLHAKALSCARMLALPVIPAEFQKYCKQTVLESVFLKSGQNHETLRLNWMSFQSRDYDERACAYRNWRRQSYFFQRNGYVSSSKVNRLH